MNKKFKLLATIGALMLLFTLVQDVLLVVGLLGMLITKSDKKNVEQTASFEA